MCKGHDEQGGNVLRGGKYIYISSLFGKIPLDCVVDSWLAYLFITQSTSILLSFVYSRKLYKCLSLWEDMQKEGYERSLLRARIGRKAQITLFVIVALLIVGIVLVLLLWPTIRTSFVKEINPEEYIRTCTSQYVEEAIDLSSRRGGSIEPVHTVSFQGQQVEYLCYTNDYYKTCVMQQPLLKQHVEYEVVNYVKPKVEGCVQNLQSEMEKRGYTVSYKRPDVSVAIIPKNVNVNVKLDMKITKESTATYETVRVSVKNPMYDLLMISGSILNFEARYGDADPLGFMFYYPNLKVQKIKQDDGTKIYILQDRDSGQTFQFASRSLSWPAGYTGVDNLALYPGRK